MPPAADSTSGTLDDPQERIEDDAAGAAVAAEVDFDDEDADRHDDGAVEHGRDDGRQGGRRAERGDQQRDAHIAGVGEDRRQAMQAEGGQAVGEQPAGAEHRDSGGDDDAAAIAGEEAPVQHIGDADARGRDEEQRRQREEVDEAVERFAAGLAEQAEAAAEIAGEDDAEHRQDAVRPFSAWLQWTNATD